MSVRVTSPTRETLFGRRSSLRQDFDVVFANFDDRLITDHVHVGRCGIEQDGLLDAAQDFPAGADGGFGFVDAVQHAAAAEQWLHGLDAIAARVGFDLAGAAGTVSVFLKPNVGAAGHGRAIAGIGAGNFFIGCAQGGTGGIKLGVGAIGFGERLIQGFGSDGLGQANGREHHRRECKAISHG